MKIILSRKGFDSSTGGIASPIILPGERLLSLPIPVTAGQTEKKEKGIPYDDLRFDGQTISKIIEDLYRSPRRRQKEFPYRQAHLDPDLVPERLENRGEGWMRTFGQQGSAQGYLRNRGVGEGDLFLFFGWFKRAERENNRLHYVQSGRNLHVIFGWLQVGKILKVCSAQNLAGIPNWLRYHPHVPPVVNGSKYTNNTIYVASEQLMLDGQAVGGGAGTFPSFKSSLQLTAPEEECMSHWSLPKWLCREYIEGNWRCDEDHLPFDSDGRRQEFVFNMPDTHEARDWVKNLFNS